MECCFYCMDKDHTAADCKLKQDRSLGRTRKRRIKKWGYMPATELMTALRQGFFASRYLAWLIHFFRYSSMDEILRVDSFSGAPTAAKNIYADPALIEAEQLLRMGEGKFKEGAYQQAVIILELVLEKTPENYRAWILKGYTHIEQSESDQALASFGSAVGIASSNYYRSLAWLLMARVNQSNQQIDQAILQLQKAICSQLSEAYYLLSLLYVEKGLINEALSQLKLAIGENREYLIASCYEPGFSQIGPELSFLLENIIRAKRKKTDPQLEGLHAAFKQVEGVEAKLYDPLDIKSARFKYLMAKRKYETQSYFGYIDAIRLANEAMAYLKVAKSSAVARKGLAVVKLKEHVQLSIKTGVLCGVCAAGWGLVVGGGIGIVLALKFGPGSNYKIITSAIKGAAIGFLLIYILNWRISHYKKKFFLKQFAKRFRYQRGGQNPK